jgi:amino acid transporter/nucleotide-binding universal stress UspA family protein
MAKRKLKRQLNLLQVVMLGTAGTLAAEIFVLTGHAAARSGADTVLALLLGGLLSYAIALNYCELATSYPVAGGAMSYVRESFGSGILSFLVGSMDCASSTFYAALSAVGFAYSLQVFFPAAPLVPVAAAVILVFVVLNVLGVTSVGNLQIVLGGLLLAVFAAYIIVGLTHPQGFSWSTYSAANAVFADQRTLPRLGRLLVTIALVYNAYVGFEVIADDAEEIRNPDRNIPRGILISLTACTIIYVATSFVTLGALPFGELAGSETALTDAARRFMPGIGAPLMAVAGMVATLTSVNSAMLSATREAFTLSRDGVWPRAFSKLSRFRTPHMAVLAIGLMSILVALSRKVDFLSYISSAGYLFVLFWGNLSMIRLRKQYPDLRRPFRAPFFPATVYIAGGVCLLLIAFAAPRALAFGAGVLALFAIPFVLRGRISRFLSARRGPAPIQDDCIIIAADNPDTARSLVHIGSILAQSDPDSYICALAIQTAESTPASGSGRSARGPAGVLGPVYREAQARNVAFYVKIREAATVDEGILAEVCQRENVRLLLAGWPTPLNPTQLAANPVKRILQHAPTHVAVLLDRGLRQIRRILVPVGGGPHSRLAIHLAQEIALSTRAQITALRVITASVESDDVEDNLAILQETLEEELGQVLEIWSPQVTQARSVADGILEETGRVAYDLVVIGASEEWPLSRQLFGAVDDWIADKAPCSVLLCRRHESLALSWVRRQVKLLYRERHPVPDTPPAPPASC